MSRTSVASRFLIFPLLRWFVWWDGPTGSLALGLFIWLCCMAWLDVAVLAVWLVIASAALTVDLTEAGYHRWKARGWRIVDGDVTDEGECIAWAVHDGRRMALRRVRNGHGDPLWQGPHGEFDLPWLDKVYDRWLAGAQQFQLMSRYEHDYERVVALERGEPGALSVVPEPEQPHADGRRW